MPLPAASIGFDRRKIESATIYKDEIFFADSADSTIKKCNKNNCTDVSILRNNTSESSPFPLFGFSLTRFPFQTWFSP